MCDDRFTSRVEVESHVVTMHQADIVAGMGQVSGIVQYLLTIFFQMMMRMKAMMKMTSQVVMEMTQRLSINMQDQGTREVQRQPLGDLESCN